MTADRSRPTGRPRRGTPRRRAQRDHGPHRRGARRSPCVRASCSRNGSTADFVRSYPVRLPYSALDIEIPLQHFSPATIRTFLLIERPQRLDGALRSAQGWTSIGQFYDFIRTGCSGWLPSPARTRSSADARSAKSARRTSTTPAVRRCPSPI
ncbi:MAG: ferritin-like domain-containing protein [Pseudonocardiaceae bacterium]